MSASSTTSSRPPVAAPRLSIVVLPFTNLSDDREQQHFADGVTEDLTTDLSRLENMFVISRNTALTYRGKPINTRQIGRELGVRERWLRRRFQRLAEGRCGVWKIQRHQSFEWLNLSDSSSSWVDD